MDSIANVSTRRPFVLVAGCLASAGAAHAAGFAISAQSASATGAAYSNTAMADDASTQWYNAAQIGRLSGISISAVVSAIDTSFKFHDAGSTGAYALPTEGNGGNGGTVAAVPALYVASALDDHWSVGLAANAPFGLKTRYDSGWRGQWVALKSESTAYDISPALSYRVGRSFWVGGALDLAHFDADLSNFAGPLGTADLKAGDNGIGYHVGATWVSPDGVVVSASYRSDIKYHLKGYTSLSALGPADHTSAQADLTVPESVIVAAVVPLAVVNVTGTVTWTRWNRLTTLDVTATSTSALAVSGAPLTSLPFEWRNTLTVALGADYAINPLLKVRTGLAHEPSASTEATRTPRLPDQSRFIAGVGLQAKPTDTITVDAAVGHDFVKNAGIDDTAPGVPGQLIGNVRSSVNVLSLQYNQRF